MKFKVGDKVLVKEDLKVGENYGSEKFVSEMEKFKGRVVTIQKVNYGWSQYNIEEDEDYCWTDEMLENYKLYENGDIEKLQNSIKELKLENSFLSGKLAGYREILEFNNKEEN